MPPAFVLSQNQTLKLMYDKPGRNRPRQAGISGSRSCTNIQTGVFAYEDICSSRQASPTEITLRNGINLTDRSIPRGYRRPGRRPHVPSSKPTMSKSRTLLHPGPCGSGYGLYQLRQAQNGARPVGPCSVAGEAYMERLFSRQHPVANFSQKCSTKVFPLRRSKVCGPRSRRRPNNGGAL